MPYTVLRVADLARAVEEMSKRERRAYEAAVDGLRGEGCRAAGKRVASITADDYPMCQRSLYAAWRMVTVYRQDQSIVIVAVGRHTEAGSPISALSDSFPGLSATGRRRSEQPPCCEDEAAPPTLSDELEARLAELYGF